jgi:hypothetical protein
MDPAKDKITPAQIVMYVMAIVAIAILIYLIYVSYSPAEGFSFNKLYDHFTLFKKKVVDKLPGKKDKFQVSNEGKPYKSLDAGSPMTAKSFLQNLNDIERGPGRGTGIFKDNFVTYKSSNPTALLSEERRTDKEPFVTYKSSNPTALLSEERRTDKEPFMTGDLNPSVKGPRSFENLAKEDSLYSSDSFDPAPYGSNSSKLDYNDYALQNSAGNDYERMKKSTIKFANENSRRSDTGMTINTSLQNASQFKGMNLSMLMKGQTVTGDVEVATTPVLQVMDSYPMEKTEETAN